MKKQALLLSILLIFLAGIIAVYAQASGGAEHDTFVDGTAANFDDFGSLLLVSTSASSGCFPATGVLIQKDLSGSASRMIGATLDVVIKFNDVFANVTLELFEADADFDETTVGGPLSNRVGNTLSSSVIVNSSMPVGTVLTFPSTSSFVAYSEAARVGDGKASFVIQITDCPFGVHFLDLKEKESGTAPLFTFLEAAVPVVIDIKPGSDPNSINCNNEKGVIPVAILTTGDFDATTVDHTMVTFEGAGETHVHKQSGEPKRHEEDVDGDGDVDLVFHFRLGDTTLTCASTEGTLVGETLDGQAIEGTDSVLMHD